MRALLLVLFLTACAAETPPAPPPVSACREERFEGNGFVVCDPGKGRIEIRAGSRTFPDLHTNLRDRAANVSFAMNAGMFDDEGGAIGLLVEDGREVHPINRRKGYGNFHLLPNGVFLVRRDGRAEVVSSDAFRLSGDIAFATQSGPMLLIDGDLHPSIEPDGVSRYVRNGVGIAPSGTPLFVISIDAVSFGRLARFMRDRLGIRDALYFDGSVSSLWDPASNRMDAFTDLGPMVVTFRPAAESGPRREGRATP